MPNYTPKYNLAKPLDTELYDIDVFNSNMDKIEAVLSNGLTYLGANLIALTSDDTFDKWFAAGTGYVFYSFSKALNGQPSQYGFLINIAIQSNVAQLWFALPQGTIYYRGGNTNGLATSWAKVLSSGNISDTVLNSLGGILSPEKGGTGKTNLADAYKELAKRTSIHNDSLLDANTLTAPGVHQVYIENMSISFESYNLPHRYGMLIVDGYAAYVSQTFYSLGDKKMYYRTSHNMGAEWTDWNRVYDTGNKPTPEDIGAVKKSGDAMTGSLSVTRFGIQALNDYPTFGLKRNSDIEEHAFMQTGTNGAFGFYSYNADMDGKSARYREGFSLPGANSGLTANKTYAILTSKNPVTVAQGGTGATDAKTARKNLGVPYYAEYSGGKMQMGAGSASAWVTFNADDGTSNQMDLTKTATQFSKPVNIASGGTGANTASAAVANLWSEIAKKIEATYNVTKK